MLEDEAVKKIAENPKKLAFFRAIEDRDDEDEDLDVLDETPPDSMEQDDVQRVPDSQGENLGTAARSAPSIDVKRKRPLHELHLDPGNRPPAPARRTGIAGKPPSLLEMRESLSFLTEHPADVAIGPMEPSSDLSGGEDLEHRHPRRTAAPIVDRLAVKRTDSAASAGSAAVGGCMAFHDPRARGDAPGFRVPSLLRRATSSFSTDEHGISHATGDAARRNSAQREGMRAGGTKKSGVGWQVKREREKKLNARIEERGRMKKVGKNGKAQGGFLAGLFKENSWE